MKPAIPPGRAPYRNAIIYRSAQRLIASRPPRPRRALPPRTLVFLVGLACGLGLAAFFLRPKPEAASSDGEQTASAWKYPNRKRPNLRLPQPLPAINGSSTGSSTLTPPTDAEKTSPEPSAAEIPTSAASTATPQRPSPPRASSPAPFAPTTTPATIVTRFTTRFKLQGELRGASGQPPIPVELELTLLPERIGGLLEGSLRFLDRPQNSPIKLSGVWVNRTFTLREANKILSTGEYPRDAYTFVIEFPAAAESNEVRGYWNRNGFTGILALFSISPF